MNCDKEILKLYVSLVSVKIYQKGNKLMNIIFLSEIADKAFIDYMKTRGTVILVPNDDRFDSRISSHPDLVISILDDSLIIDENAHINIYKQLEALGVPYVVGNSRLAAVYPQDIAYNAVITKDFLIHNLDYTDTLLSMHSTYTNKKLIPVKQGYTKCSTVVVNNDSVITSDQGIYQAAKDFMNILLIKQGHVFLEGYDSGFLGGASASFDDTVVFHGDLSKHPDFLRISSFLEAAQKRLHYFKEFPLTDIGSILIYRHQESKNVENLGYQKHVNIPIFISHEGCPNDCVFCNQRKITAKAKAMTLQEVSEQIRTYYSTLDDQTYIEIAFFGGSFTGIDITLQENYLKLAYEYKKAGKIHAIRLSTRPDYISRDILDRLRLYEVDTIELGVQSFDEEVLKASNRGHLVSDVYQAVRLIKEYGFLLGIQLMVGLPEDTKERAILSSKLTALLKPEFVRIYPTLVIKETELLELYNQGKYRPLSIETAVDWTKEMYQVFLADQIPVIRIGLQPTDLIAEGKEVLYGPFHPAFRQLVESAYFLDYMRRILSEQRSLCEQSDIIVEPSAIKILCNPKDLSQVIGHKRTNLITLQRVFPKIQVMPDISIKPMTVKFLL
jgi:radical SAM superfamily enzyme